MQSPDSFEKDVEKIACPDQIPTPPPLHHLPPAVLHSNTVQTLIGQNEDLTARLHVNLKRNALLEQNHLQLQQQMEKMQEQMAVLEAQNEIWAEKERLSKNRDTQILSETTVLKDQLEITRLQAYEARRQSENLEQQMRRLQSYRRRVQKWVRGLIENLQLQTQIEKGLQSQLEKDLNFRVTQLTELRARASDLVQHVQNQEKKFQKDRSLLVEQYEKQAKDLQNECARLQKDLTYHKERSLKYDSAITDKIEIENQAIHLERRLSDLEAQSQQELIQLQNQISIYRAENKAQSIEVQSLQEKLAEAEALESQLESLQSLWSDQQKELETLRLKNESMNKINQDLSRRLKNARQQVETQAVTAVPEEGLSIETHRRIRKIDDLLMELQSGFQMTKGDLKFEDSLESNTALHAEK